MAQQARSQRAIGRLLLIALAAFAENVREDKAPLASGQVPDSRQNLLMAAALGKSRMCDQWI